VQAGFIKTHLFHQLSLYQNEFETNEINDDFFEKVL